MASTCLRFCGPAKHPVFPHFKPLEMADRPVLEAYTEQFEPYSDFAFSTLTFYNVDQHTHWCWLNENLVFRFSDCFGPGTFFTFLGINRAVATADILINHALETNCSTVLWRIPEETAKAIASESSSFHIKPDRDGFDYMYSAESLTTMRGRAISHLRKNAHRFEKEYPQHRVIELDLHDHAARATVLSVASSWNISQGHRNTAECYCAAMDRCLSRVADFDLMGIGVVIGHALAGCFLGERTSRKILLGHFMVRCPEYSGLGHYLIHKLGNVASRAGILHIDAAEDCGDPGLRVFKRNCAPSAYLKRFSITRVAATDTSRV